MADGGSTVVTEQNVRRIASALSVSEMSGAELEEWVRCEVAEQTRLLREQVGVLQAGLAVVQGQLEHMQRILDLVGTLAKEPPKG